LQADVRLCRYLSAWFIGLLSGDPHLAGTDETLRQRAALDQATLNQQKVQTLLCHGQRIPEFALIVKCRSEG